MSDVRSGSVAQGKGVANPYRSEAARDRADASYDAILARWPVPYQTRFVETRLGPTHVLSFGDPAAPPLVLLHGMSTNATSWFPLARALGASRRVHAPDTIGDFGKSAGTRPRYDSGDHARWLADVLDGLGLGRVPVAGLSAGGWISLQLALARPERVERLALLAPASLQRMRAGMMLRGILGTVFPRPAIVRHLFRYLAADPTPVMPGWAMDDVILRWQLGRPNSLQIPVVRDAQLAALGVPTLLLLGADDPIYDARAAALRVHRVAPSVRIEILPGGHLFPSQHPDRTSDALLAFLSRTGGAQQVGGA